MNQTYYPSTNDGRADWWANILINYTQLTSLGFTVAELTPIIQDGTWGVYLYRTIRTAYDEMQAAVIDWCNAYTDGASGAPVPPIPVVPTWPTLPPDGTTPGIEARRLQWVQRAKASPNYTASIGTQLGIETANTPFDPATYQAVLFGLTSPSAHTIAGKFRKAGGQIDGINLYGRKEGTMPWALLGRFNATPFSAMVPIAVANVPEAWEFLARAVKKDVEIGLPSNVVQQIVRG